jgi:hypothetical protein
VTYYYDVKKVKASVASGKNALKEKRRDEEKMRAEIFTSERILFTSVSFRAQ